MDVKILSVTRARLAGIWDYTDSEWGASQADKYVRELIRSIHALPKQTWKWRPMQRPALSQGFFVRHQHHYIFFRKMKSGDLGVINILHENMNIPVQLKKDWQKSETEFD